MKIREIPVPTWLAGAGVGHLRSGSLAPAAEIGTAQLHAHATHSAARILQMMVPKI